MSQCTVFDFRHHPYEQEARKLWGDEAVDQSNAKLKNMSQNELEDLSKKMDAIFRRLAALRQQSPASDDAQTAIHDWYEQINQFGTYTPEAFKYLGQMYVDDARFTKNIDRYGEGLAQFMCEAMAIYAENHQQQ